MNCGTLSRLRQAAGLLALSKFATLAPQQYNRRADSYLARYAARNANFVLVVRPHNGLGARSAPKDAGLTSRRALPGPGSPTRVFGALGGRYQGAEPLGPLCGLEGEFCTRCVGSA